MKIISFSNQKGGVGKTTSAVNLSACLAEAGLKILLIDLDPQANATSALGISASAEEGMYHPMLGIKDIKEQVRPTSLKNLEIVPSHLDLSGIEIELAKVNNHLSVLQDILSPLKLEAKYDFCVLDTPPSLGILMTSALAAADEILIPLQCEYFGLEGLSKIVHVLDVIKQSGANPEVIIEGIVMTLYDSRTNLSQQVVDDVKNHFNEVIYDTIIPRTVRLGEAPSFGKSIIEYDKNGAGSQAYRKLAKEFLRRHGLHYPDKIEKPHKAIAVG